MALIISLLVLVLGGSSAQDYFEGRHVQRFHTNVGHLHEIPKFFEVKSENSEADIMPLIRDVNNLAKQRNLTITYKVRVIVTGVKGTSEKKLLQYGKKSKKYNIPLKRQNMKVSNFELLKNRAAKDHERIIKKFVREQKRPLNAKEIYSTKAPFMGKYKPIPKKVKTNFSKLIKPVRSRVIQLDTPNV